MPVTVIVNLTFRPGRVADGVAELKRILPDTRSFDGIASLDVVRDQADPDRVALIEQWQARENQERYMDWRNETGTLVALGEMLAGPPEVTYFDVLSDV
jgi:quinol monooxygenase YgiN